MKWSLRPPLDMPPLANAPGARGVRVPIGPAGTYVALGAHGFEYREKLAAPTAGEHPHGYIHTATATDLALLAPDTVVHDIQERLRRPDWFTRYLWTAGVLALWACSLHPVIGALCLALAAVPAHRLYRWNDARRTTRMYYDIDDPRLVERLILANTAGRSLGAAMRLWHIFYAAPTSDWKRNAGADRLIQRTPTHASAGSLPQISLNIEPWCVPFGPQKLLFLPDRLFVWDGAQLVGLPYAEIVVRAGPTRFIEDGDVPADSRQVGSTWRFVNKNGGPDRRYSNNKQLPVMEYGEIELGSAGGLRVVLQTSTAAAAIEAARALGALAAAGAHRPATRTFAPPPLPPVYPPPSEPSAPDHARSVAVLLRHVASADRRISAEELEFARQVVTALGHPAHDGAAFEAWFRALPGDAGGIDAAVADVRRLGPDRCREVCDWITRLSTTDGRATPKEIERIAELTQRLAAA